MVSFLLAFFTFVLIVVCLFLVLLVLMQKPSSSGGIGAAMGGGAVESAFGVQTQAVLAKGTLYAVILFFTLAFGLYLGFLKQGHGRRPQTKELPVLEGLAAPIAAGTSESAEKIEQAALSQMTEGSGDAQASATLQQLVHDIEENELGVAEDAFAEES